MQYLVWLQTLSVLGEPLKIIYYFVLDFLELTLYPWRYALLNPSFFVHVKKPKNAQIMYLDCLAY